MLGRRSMHADPIEERAERALASETHLAPENRHSLPTASTVCMADVEPRAIEWLWRPRIALGKLTIIAGDPGLGKSMLTASIAAHVSVGRNWPDGAHSPSGSVVLVSGEDDPGDTIRPRLDAAGANVQRVHYLSSVKDGGNERGFTLADVDPLSDLLDRLGDCKLIVIDPVSAYLAGTDSHKNADIRALLTPLAQLAANHGVAIVAVSHLNKAQAGNALSRVTGSLAFVAAARAAYVVARDLDDPVRRLVLPIKNNLGNDQTGMAYRIREERGVPYVQWERDPITITADEALAPAQDSQRSTRSDAADFLTSILGSLPVAVDTIKQEARAAGHSWSTVRRAKDAIGAKSKKSAFGEGWCWLLPVSRGSESKVPNPGGVELSTFGKSEHLRGLQSVEGAEGAQDAHPGKLSTFEEIEHLGPGCSPNEYSRASEGA